jgi:hypothetical protein
VIDIWKDYYKVLDVIDSCVTLQQLEGASRMLRFWFDKHSDLHVYNNTIKNKIEPKFKEIGGKNIDTLIY